MGAFPCPCCGFLVFEEPPGSYDICPVCKWEDCAVQLRHPDSPYGPNPPLAVAQVGLLERLPADVRSFESFSRDISWRPLRESDFAIEESAPRDGSEYFEAVAQTGEELAYYWRKDLKSSNVGEEDDEPR